LQKGSRDTKRPKGCSGGPQELRDLSEDLKKLNSLVCYPEACRVNAKLRSILFSHLQNAVLMDSKGIDLTQPSKFQMLKLATNSEFREATKNVVQEFQNAGVDLSSKVASLLHIM
jgi:hypothetical protein